MLIQLNYVPFQLLFLQSIYNFTTFKVLPPEVIEAILSFLGMSKEEEITDELNDSRRRL